MESSKTRAWRHQLRERAFQMKSLAPGFLIASPHLQDPNFEQAVVLMIEHNETGAMGLVLNRSAPLTMGHLGKSQELEVIEDRRDDALYHGGPVEPYRGFVLHDSKQVEESTELLPGVFLSMTGDSLAELLRDGAVRMRFFLGCSGWGPGQLEKELKEGTWLVGEASHDLVLHEPAEEIWDEVMKRMGIDPAWVMPSGGVN
jgi:putative transcriptional regulator